MTPKSRRPAWPRFGRHCQNATSAFKATEMNCAFDGADKNSHECRDAIGSFGVKRQHLRKIQICVTDAMA